MLVAMHGVNYERRGFSMEDFAALAQQAKESDEVPTPTTPSIPLVTPLCAGRKQRDRHHHQRHDQGDARRVTKMNQPAPHWFVLFLK